MVINETKIKEALRSNMKSYTETKQFLLEQLDTGERENEGRKMNTSIMYDGRTSGRNGRVILAGLLAMAAIAVIAVILIRLIPSLHSPVANDPELSSDGGNTLISEIETEDNEETEKMNDTRNIITEVHQVILDYYAAYIEIYKGADIHIIENYLDMDKIQSQNIVTALEIADFSRKYISDEYGIKPEIKDDYPYTVNFLTTSFNGENTCTIRLSIDMEPIDYPPAFSASEQEYQLEKENDSWKITHHTWDGMAVFEVSDTELLNWDREARISILQSIYGNGESMEKSAGSYIKQDRFGYGLIDTGLAYIRSEEPAFTNGISLCDTYLYPAPAESIYELGVVYQGRKVEILKEIRAGIYDEFDVLTESEWYLVTADALGSVGYIKKENIGNEDEVQVEAGAPWQIRAGSPYYFSSACTSPQSDDYPRGPLWIAGEDQKRGIIALDGLSGFRAYINDMNSLESFTGLGRRRNSRAG